MEPMISSVIFSVITMDVHSRDKVDHIITAKTDIHQHFEWEPPMIDVDVKI